MVKIEALHGKVLLMLTISNHSFYLAGPGVIICPPAEPPLRESSQRAAWWPASITQ
jgi:hypothetical protein